MQLPDTYVDWESSWTGGFLFLASFVGELKPIKGSNRKE
ncbi:hypothetical protein ABID49_002667 [Bhargavaea ullalensis]|uniref:Uncharacterized protein n=1 Tax=Bhargavaea ullalensis TaxID=1265685 RepID=A0ABV2GET8_9BACL